MTQSRTSFLALAALGAALLAPSHAMAASASAAAKPAASAPAPAPRPVPAWIQHSNQYSQKLLAVMAKFAPEQAVFFGVEGFDEQIFDLQPRYAERSEEAVGAVQKEYEAALATEKDPKVRQDLAILIDATKLNNDQSAVGRRTFLPYTELNSTVFQGLRALLDDQVAPARRQKALVRLKKYTGMLPGTQSLTELAMADTRAKLSDTALLGPPKDQ